MRDRVKTVVELRSLDLILYYIINSPKSQATSQINNFNEQGAWEHMLEVLCLSILKKVNVIYEIYA